MKIFGFSITRAVKKALSPVLDNRGWYRVFESFTGAWQQNVTVDYNGILASPAIFACQTLIASDISKLRVKLVEQDADGIWSETQNPAYTPVLRKPNRFQNRIQFWENWMLSKLMRGNAYVLKERDNRGVVTRLYILDPNRVKPMIADDGAVFYELQTDNVTGLIEPVMVPASEIIHDRFNCLFHPLVGVSPIFACALSAMQGLNIQTNSTAFFGNRSMPGGILTAPGAIGDETATRLKTAWEANYGGENRGKVAVLGDGLKFEPIMMTSVDSQLVEQLKWTAETVCSTFHVPPYKIGIGPMPTYNNIQALNVEYYSQCLQVLIEAAEVCLDEGLEMRTGIGTEFDLDNLLRMDSVTQMAVLKEGIDAAVFAPNEARRKLDLKPVPGGDSPMAQQQDFSLAALAKRDAKDDPFGSGKPASNGAPPALPAPSGEKELSDAGAVRRQLATRIRASADRFRRAA